MTEEDLLLLQRRIGVGDFSGAAVVQRSSHNDQVLPTPEAKESSID
jgi:hypothetical protein